MAVCPYCGTTTQAAVCPNCGRTLPGGENTMLLPPGTRLTGNLLTYEVETVLGKGGFGVTYRAKEQGTNREVAVKEYFPVRSAQRAPDLIMTAKSGMEEEFRRGLNRFSEEARMLASLRNLPSVVQVMDCFQHGGTAYLVMEFLDGEPTYRKAASMGGKIPAPELISKLRPLLDDLEQVHNAGVLHRDITPDNIMWMPDGTLKLLDFGSARSMEGSQSMTVQLKLGFAPVEQYLSHGQGPYTDVYALCATVYYLITGVMPQSAVERLDVDALQPPTSLGADLSGQEEAAILHGMRVQPRERTQTMAQLREELYLPGRETRETSVPSPAPTPEPPREPVNREPRKMSLLQRILGKIWSLFG